MMAPPQCSIVAILLLALLVDVTSAWSNGGGSRRSRMSKSSDVNVNHHTTINISRRNACQTLLTVTAPIISTLIPNAANADVTNKVASSTALRSLSRAQRALPTKLLPPAQSNNYIGVKTALREPPFDTLRKDMLTLVRGGEDGPLADKLLLSYKQLIKSLEAIDATSSLGMRGRGGIDPFELGIEYDAIVKAMVIFIGVASDAAGIPIQEDTTQTQVGSIDVRSGKVTSRVL